MQPQKTWQHLKRRSWRFGPFNILWTPQPAAASDGYCSVHELEAAVLLRPGEDHCWCWKFENPQCCSKLASWSSCFGKTCSKGAENHLLGTLLRLWAVYAVLSCSRESLVEDYRWVLLCDIQSIDRLITLSTNGFKTGYEIISDHHKSQHKRFCTTACSGSADL